MLADLKLPSTTIVSVEMVAAGAFKPPAGAFVLPGTDPFKSLPAFRRVVGAPANDWTRLMLNAAFISQIMLSDAANYIPAKKMKAIEAAALSSCDTADGLKDGLIDDPTRCRFDPSVLLCSGPETDACLTTAQVETLKKSYAGARDAKGSQLSPSYVPGGETGFLGWELWISGPAPGKSALNTLSRQYFKRMVFADENWDFKSLNAERDLKLAEQKLGPILNSTNPDLKAFKKRGGKLIIYHGWSEGAIPPEMAINY